MGKTVAVLFYFNELRSIGYFPLITRHIESTILVEKPNTVGMVILSSHKLKEFFCFLRFLLR